MLLHRLLAGLAALVALSANAEELPGKPRGLTFGIVPQHAASKTAELWLPLLVELERRLGTRVEFVTEPDIPTFARKLGEGAYDIAYMNPQHYAVFLKAYHYNGIATDAGAPLTGVIVVGSGHGDRGLEALAGKTVCYPSPEAFGATKVVQRHLAAAGVRAEARYVGSHDSVYRLVANGTCGAGGGVRRTLDLMAPAVRERLQVAWESHPLPNHVIAVARRVPASLRERIAQALLDISENPATRPLLAQAGLTRLTPVDDSHYAIILTSPRRTAQNVP